MRLKPFLPRCFFFFDFLRSCPFFVPLGRPLGFATGGRLIQFVQDNEIRG